MKGLTEDLMRNASPLVISEAKDEVRVYIPITRIDEEQRRVYGYGVTTTPAKSDKRSITLDAIKRAIPGWLEFGNIREMHQLSAVGVSGSGDVSIDDKGAYLGSEVVDDDAWKKVKKGVYKGYSVGGKVLKRKGSEITEIRIDEFSLVDRPDGPDCTFDMWRRDASENLSRPADIDACVSKMEKEVGVDNAYAICNWMKAEGKGYFAATPPSDMKAIIEEFKLATGGNTNMDDVKKALSVFKEKVGAAIDEVKAATKPEDLKRSLWNVGELLKILETLTFMRTNVKMDAEMTGVDPGAMGEIMDRAVDFFSNMVVVAMQAEVAKINPEAAPTDAAAAAPDAVVVQEAAAIADLKRRGSKLAPKAKKTLQAAYNQIGIILGVKSMDDAAFAAAEAEVEDDEVAKAAKKEAAEKRQAEADEEAKKKEKEEAAVAAAEAEKKAEEERAAAEKEEEEKKAKEAEAVKAAAEIEDLKRSAKEKDENLAAKDKEIEDLKRKVTPAKAVVCDMGGRGAAVPKERDLGVPDEDLRRAVEECEKNNDSVGLIRLAQSGVDVKKYSTKNKKDS